MHWESIKSVSHLDDFPEQFCYEVEFEKSLQLEKSAVCDFVRQQIRAKGSPASNFTLGGVPTFIGSSVSKEYQGQVLRNYTSNR